MWVWPQLVFGGSPPPSPLAIGGPFPQAKALPSPPSSSLFPERGGPVWCGGRGPRVQGGVAGEGPPALLGARPTSGGTRMKCWLRGVPGLQHLLRCNLTPSKQAENLVHGRQFVGMERRGLPRSFAWFPILQGLAQF